MPFDKGSARVHSPHDAARRAPTTSAAAGRPTADRRLSRRDWLLVAGTWLGPAVARAQAARRPLRIALLPDFMPLWDMLLKWFVEDLQGHGHVEGRDYVFLRSGIVYGEDAERAVRFAVDAQPDLIFACNLGYIIKAHERTKTIPIVMWASGFPVEGGVADSLGRPGRNVTGLTIYADTQIFAKQVQLLLEVKPGIRRIGALCSYVPPLHPAVEARMIIESMSEAGRRLGVDVRIYEVARPEQVTDALAAAAADRVDALLVTSGDAVFPRRADILRFAFERRLPAIADSDWDTRLYTHGLLLSYAAQYREVMRQAAVYVDRILWRGARPGDLAIQLPAKFEFVVNLKTARAMGLQVPPSVLLRADTVIE